ncbi:hypothetical protein BI350_14475 [Sporosarcina ureilytica]|uniref:histidine kinase n=2 Tax=Sporosarcina ureilytica TaxID=298596 RepID=A0A1D8JKN2_9BACL|nr:hypothetical protein BI350_14475 [Sporosarcina ureilytica]
MRSFISKYLFFSFSSTINAFYISIILLFIFITGGVSYQLAKNQIEENTYQSMNDTVLQTSNYLEFVFSDVFEQLVLLSNHKHLSTLLDGEAKDINSNVYIELDNEINTIYHRFPSIIESIYIDIDDGKITFSNGSEQVNPLFSYKDYFVDHKGSKESYYWKNAHLNNLAFDNYKVMSVFKLLEAENSSRNGIVLFTIRADFVEKILNKSFIGESGYLTLVSPDGSTFESEKIPGKFRIDDKTLAKITNSNVNEGKISFENAKGKNLNAIYHTIGVNKWKVVAVFPESQILKTMNNMKYFMTIFLIAVIIMAVFIVNGVGKYISNPIKKLADQMKKADQELLQTTEGIAVPKEMEILYSSFNEQMARNQALLEQIKLEQKEKRQLEVAIIKAQVNPHFLYNTLYSIKGLCDMGLNKDASEMISALSSFFRISISRGNEIISIKEEISHIKSYLYIMEMRYGDNFTYTLDVDKETLSSQIIKLTLQPLIENAIYHGVKLSRKQGLINVNVYKQSGKIHLEVKDNGLGIERERLERIKEEINAPYSKNKREVTGIGLRSVSERLKGYFGSECELMIESVVGKGTKIIIKIPSVKEGNGEYEQSNHS